MIRKFLISALSLSAVILQVSAGAMTLPVAQEQKEEAEDSLVRLLSGKSAQLLEIDGMSYRKIVGPAVFFHNNTYLHCDTALWNVDTRIIDAIGNVRIVQEQTELQSEKMQYFIDRDLAEFRGDIVQLRDRDGNTLRTKFLDYNTKDSVGIFFRGGSMRDKDGQIIESQRGTYDSKIRVFDFAADVNMFTDSIFIKTNTLKYESDYSLATFGTGTNAWKDDYMLSSEAGWYDRDGEQFFFRRNVHLMSATQEAWCDTLYFDRNTSDVRMYGHIQVTDTTRNVYALAGRMDYVDSVSTVTMTEDPAVVLVVEENARRDSVYCGADTLIYRSKLLCEVDSVLVAEASLRRQNMDIDPVMEFRRKAAEEAARKAAEEAEKAESVAATLGDLEARVAELGKSEAELTLRTLEANGATEAQMERARELLALLEDAGENPLESWQDRLHETIAAALVDLGDFAGGARLLIADIGTQLAGIAAEGLLEGISALGEALAQGADGAASMQEALADMARQILEQLPALFLNAGLTMIANGNWAVGLGLIAAAGVSAFSGGVVEGLYGDDDDDEEENAKGGVYGPGGRMAFAKGGAFTNRIVTSPTEFRFARGGRFGRGLMGEAGPEAILPLRRMGDGSLGVASQGGGGGITVVINNYSQESVSAKEGQGADGMRQLEVTIGAVINGHISSGRADKALGGRYGLRAKGV